MRTIHRYELPITDRPVINMPVTARVLPAPSWARTRPVSRIEIWAEVDTDELLAPRHFRIVGTGNQMPDDCGRFVGTVITHGGTYVWHVYELLMVSESPSSVSVVPL